MEPEEGFGFGPPTGSADFPGRPAHKRPRYEQLPPPPLRPADAPFGFFEGPQLPHTVGGFGPARNQRRFSQSPPRLTQPGALHRVDVQAGCCMSLASGPYIRPIVFWACQHVLSVQLLRFRLGSCPASELSRSDS